jgi:hypothetical protein
MLEVIDEVALHLPPDATYGYLKLEGACRCYKDWTAAGDALPSHMTVTLTGTGDVTALWKQGSDARFLRVAVGSYSPTGVYKISYTHAAYLLHDNVDAYGVVSKDFAIKSITTPEELYLAGLNEFNKRAKPKVSYKVSAADLSEIAGREFEFLPIGSLVHAIDEGLNINTQVSVQGVKRGSLKKQGDIDYVFSNFPINLADKLIQQQEAVEALNNQGVTGVSQVVNFTTTILISDSEYPKTYKFTLNSSYIRCNKVRLTWDEDASGFGAGSENLDLDVTVDGTLVDHGTEMADEDITLYLTAPIIGTQHTIEWDYRGAPAAKTLLHIQIACQVFRRSIPL